MRKIIKVEPEQEDALWDLFAEGIGRVIDLGKGLYQVSEDNLEYLRARQIKFEIVEFDQWRWEKGYPVEKLAKVSIRANKSLFLQKGEISDGKGKRGK
ncbi:MAG: hypothetical protein QXI19_12635 [Candidatus Caldarchaeum sp.]